MSVFAVLEPPGYHDAAIRDADRFIFLHDRFSLAAFLLGPLWILWQRLWLELLVYLAGAAAVGYGLYALGVGLPAAIVVFGLIQLFLGLEATTLVRWMRIRYGWRDGGVVVADDLDMAERRFFDSRVARRSMAGAVAAETSGRTAPGASIHGVSAEFSQTGVVGLFPEPGGGR